jgi:PAS domain S-box-containing protein
MVQHRLAAGVRFERVLTRSPVAFAALSLQGLVIDANDAFAEMMGRNRDEINGESLPSFFADFERERVADHLDRLASGRVTDLHTEFQFTKPDGSLGTAVASSTAIIDDDAQCVVVLLQDVTSHRRAERASTALRERLELVGRAADLVHVELAVRPRMEAFARMVVPAFADVCAVYLRAPDGNLWLRRFAAAPDDVATALEPLRDLPVARTNETPIALAVRTRKAVRVERFDTSTTHWGPDNSVREVLRDQGVVSLLCAPLVNHNDAFGVVLFGLRDASRRVYDTDDELFGSDLVSRVSGALSNAIQFEDEHIIAERLQRALLPERVPEVTGADIAVRYRPSSGRGVGGDWYDVINLPDGRVAFAVGDVTGHGVEAAVAMSAIRHALLAYAFESSDPVELMGKINRYLCRQPGRTTATLALVVCDLISGELTIATAGHLPVIVRDASGAVAFHGERLGRPLGLSPNAAFQSESARLPSGGVLVLHTDGLIERRSESLVEGLERLAARVAHAAADAIDLENFADAIEAGVAAPEGIDAPWGVDAPDDDIALLVVRRSGSPDHFETVVEARADRLGSVRSDLRRWLSHVGCPEPDASDLVLAISECAANVVEHAYPPGVTGSLEISAGLEPRGPDDTEIAVSIRDHGRWRVPRDVGGGRGHELLRHLVDEARFDTGTDGTAVALTRRVSLVGR